MLKLRTKLRNCSVPTPIQSDGISMLDYTPIINNLPSINELTRTTQQNINSLRLDSILFLQLTFLYCTRFIELYSASFRHYIHPDRIIIPGAKGSASMILYIPGIKNLVTSQITKINPYLFPKLSYKSVYSDFKKLDLPILIMGTVNKTVTHYGRKTLDQLTKNILTDRELSDLLHHRSKTNSTFYREQK